MAFTSSVISTVSIGTWDYFIMSDNTAVWRAMNGLAAWFSGSSGIIQGAALLGSLISLSMILFGAATHSKSSVGIGTLGGWFFFMSMMGVTGQAQVTNIYTNQVTIINNVPALALVPASMFSKAAYSIFTSMETSFQSVTGSYMSVDQNAFVGPLDILLSLRSPNFPATAPALNKSLVQVVHDCGDNPLGGAAPPMEDAKDALAWLQTWGRLSGMTKIYPPTDTTGQGTLMDCTSALSYINTQFSAYAGGNSALMAFVNSETTKKNPQSPSGAWNGGSVQASFDFLFGAVPGMQQSALEFTKNALTATAISYTKDCATQSGMLTTAENCMAGSLAAADGKERWKTDAAMAGSGFLKTMFTSMGFLQVLFFALFPFIAIYGLVVVNKTASVFGGYVLIGIWSQSWMIVVAPIQSYIQTSVIDDMTKALSLSHAVTLGNIGTVYDQLSTKLAVASDMMANAQMLSLALLSGSVFAMSSLAGKWSGTGHNDSSLLHVKPLENSPMYKSAPVGGTVSNFRNDRGSVTQTLDAPGGAAWSSGTTYTTNQSEVSGYQKSRMSTEQRAGNLSASVRANTGFTLSKEDSASIVKSQDAATSFTGGISAGVAGDILKGLNKAGALKGLSGKALENVTGTAKKAQGAAVSQLAAKDSSFISKLSSADAEERGEAWAKVAETAVDMLTVGTLAAEVLTGVGAAATPATLAMGMAARGGIRAAVKGSVSANTKRAGAEAAKTESGVMSKLSHLPGAIADGVAGNVDAMAKAVLTDGIKKSNSYNASKKNTVGKDVGVSETDGLTRAVTGSVGDSFSKTSGKGQTTTASTTLDHASLSRIGTSGFNGKSSDQVRQDAATAAAMLRLGQIKKMDGSAFTKDEIVAADQAVAAGMLGHSSGDAGLDQFKKNVMFEQALTNAVSGSLGSGGPGLPVGANFTNGMKVEAAPGKPAVAATKGHWAKNGKQQTPKDEALTLKKWGDGGDPQNKAAKGAAKEGLHWVAGTAAQAGSEGGLRLQDASQAEANVNTTAPSGGIGAGMEKGKGSAAFQAVEARIIPSADKALEARSKAAISADTALAELSPKADADFADKKKTVIGLVAAAGVAKVAADAVGGLLGAVGAGASGGTGVAGTGAGTGTTAGKPAGGATGASGAGGASTGSTSNPVRRLPPNRVKMKTR